MSYCSESVTCPTPTEDRQEGVEALVVGGGDEEALHNKLNDDKANNKTRITGRRLQKCSANVLIIWSYVHRGHNLVCADTIESQDSMP
eukprot:scaffold1690_cov182-Amphora_coffeaeformis.AAC.20